MTLCNVHFLSLLCYRDSTEVKKQKQNSDNNFMSSGHRWWSIVDVKNTLQIWHICASAWFWIMMLEEKSSWLSFNLPVVAQNIDTEE